MTWQWLRRWLGGRIPALAVLLVCICLGHPRAAAAILERPDVSYGPDPRELLDLCLPGEGQGAHPAVLFIHGGGWNAGHKEDYRGLCRMFAEHGIVAATMEYRFADGTVQGAWPAQLLDAQRAVRWLRSHANELKINPRRVCADGDSAGAHIAVFLAITREPLEKSDDGAEFGFSSFVDCAIDNFGPVDFTTPAPFLSALNRLFPHMAESQRIQRAHDVSPLLSVGPSTAPIFVAHGFHDTAVPIAQSFALVEALQRANVQTEFVAFDGGHEFSGLSGDARNAIIQLETEFIRNNNK